MARKDIKIKDVKILYNGQTKWQILTKTKQVANKTNRPQSNKMYLKTCLHTEDCPSTKIIERLCCLCEEFASPIKPTEDSDQSHHLAHI